MAYIETSVFYNHGESLFYADKRKLHKPLKELDFPIQPEVIDLQPDENALLVPADSSNHYMDLAKELTQALGVQPRALNTTAYELRIPTSGWPAVIVLENAPPHKNSFFQITINFKTDSDEHMLFLPVVSAITYKPNKSMIFWIMEGDLGTKITVQRQGMVLSDFKLPKFT